MMHSETWVAQTKWSSCHPLLVNMNQGDLRIQPTRAEEQRRDDTGHAGIKATRCYKRSHESKALMYEVYHAAIRRTDTDQIPLGRIIGQPKYISLLKSCRKGKLAIISDTGVVARLIPLWEILDSTLAKTHNYVQLGVIETESSCAESLYT